MKESDILYENGNFWIAKNVRGDFLIYEGGLTHATVCATIGRNYHYPNAFEYAKKECDRRAQPVQILKSTVLPSCVANTVEYEGERYIAVVQTDHPVRLGVVMHEKTLKEVRKTALRQVFERALVIPSMVKS